MSETREQLIRALECERVAPKPKPYRNQRHDYDTELHLLRRTQDPAKLAVLRYEAALATQEGED